MTTSPLVGRKLTTNKFSSRAGFTPKRLIIHHTAGGGNALAIQMLSGTLRPGDKKVSAHYILLTTAELVGSVDEEQRAWTTGWEGDRDGITVETVNTSGAPEWRVSDTQLEQLAALAADCSIRYGWGQLTRKNVMGHREFKATACPGPHIWPRMDSIVARANQIRNERLGATPPPASKPAPKAGTLEDLNELINAIVRGELGNGSDRVSALKKRGFDDAQIAAIAAEVTRRHNQAKEAAAVKVTPTPVAKPTTSDLIIVHKLINSIIRGEWGNGPARVQKLKDAGFTQDQIDALQAEISRRMRSL